ERGIAVVEVGALAAVQPGGIRQEVELPARVAGFRLPVIEVEEIQEVAAAEVVLALDLGDVRGDRVGALVAEDRVPAVAVAQLAEEAGAGPAESELGIARIALIADALIVGAGNSQGV